MVENPRARMKPENERHTNRPELKALRRDLRNHATPAERALWQMLKERRLHSRKFRRQHSVGRYVLDFYCPEEKLAVELDGGVHDDPLRWMADTQRQAALEALGLRVVRFENREVLQTPDLVVEGITRHFKPRR